ncbi:DUF1801 domain-containing protein [Candidatus Nomurabacteria bacterium]|nr:MAG: DUF1801 domain-containing protein [Candidatus Nomurabacteria bacterium]
MKSYKNITEYIKDIPKEHRGYVKTLRKLAKKLVPKGEEAIRYGMPTMQIDGKNLLHYAAMKAHFGFYPAPSGIIAFKSELDKAGIEYSKGCIRFPYNKPLPVSLITKIIKFRLKEEKSR